MERFELLQALHGLQAFQAQISFIFSYCCVHSGHSAHRAHSQFTVTMPFGEIENVERLENDEKNEKNDETDETGKIENSEISDIVKREEHKEITFDELDKYGKHVKIKFCSVPSCKYNRYSETTRENRENIYMFPIPKDLALIKLWKNALKIPENESFSGKVCIEHFNENDYKGVKRKRLKNNAIPYILQPSMPSIQTVQTTQNSEVSKTASIASIAATGPIPPTDIESIKYFDKNAKNDENYKKIAQKLEKTKAKLHRCQKKLISLKSKLKFALRGPYGKTSLKKKLANLKNDIFQKRQANETDDNLKVISTILTELLFHSKL